MGYFMLVAILFKALPLSPTTILVCLNLHERKPNFKAIIKKSNSNTHSKNAGLIFDYWIHIDNWTGVVTCSNTNFVNHCPYSKKRQLNWMNRLRNGFNKTKKIIDLLKIIMLYRCNAFYSNLPFIAVHDRYGEFEKKLHRFYFKTNKFTV